MAEQRSAESRSGRFGRDRSALRNRRKRVQQFYYRPPARRSAGRVVARGRNGEANRNCPRPGSFEIPIAAKKLAATGRFDSIICIGCVLRGETSHYDYVASETSRGIQLAQLDSGVPMMFCVLTCDTLEQAIDRAGLKGGNKGYEAGLWGC